MRLKCMFILYMSIILVLAGCSGKGNKEDLVSSATDAAIDDETVDLINFSVLSGFYSEDVSVELSKVDGVKEIRYTLDGSKPDTSSMLYEGAIVLAAGNKDFPKAYCIRAAAVLDDGEIVYFYSEEYLIGSGIETRFTTPVFLVWGKPSELTDAPNGIFYGENAKKSGKESEREVFVSAFDKDGKRLLAQNAGVRVNGKASRISM